MARRQQDGYAMLVILLVLSVFMLTLAKVVPDWKTQIQREREARSIDHAREYRTAIKRYFHKYGRYPPSIDAMVQKDGQGLRYLREEWPDPLHPAEDSSSSFASSDSVDWQVLHYGQAVNAEIVDQPPQAATNVSGIQGPNLSGGMAGGGAGPGLTGAGTGGPGAPPAGTGGAPGAGLGMGSGPGVGSGMTSGPAANLGTSTSGGAEGGPVIGVASLSKKPAVHSFNGFDIPNQWQFVYNYAQDPSLTAGGSGAPGTPAPGSSLTPPTVPSGG